MTNNKEIGYIPCMPLDKAKAIIDSGVNAVKKAREIQARLEEKGVDISSLKKKLDEEKDIKRLAERMLKVAIKHSR